MWRRKSQKSIFSFFYFLQAMLIVNKDQSCHLEKNVLYLAYACHLIVLKGTYNVEHLNQSKPIQVSRLLCYPIHNYMSFKWFALEELTHQLGLVGRAGERDGLGAVAADLLLGLLGALPRPPDLGRRLALVEMPRWVSMHTLEFQSRCIEVATVQF